MNMRVKDIKTGLIYESNNEFVIEQWKKRPERYKVGKTEKETVEPVKETKKAK